MNGKKRLYLCFSVVVTLVYTALLLTLYYSESSQEGVAIHTLGDAVWYSLVTLTTVGYGDLVPVTPLGHAVGIVFLFLATGIMVTLLGAVISFITGEVMPLFILRFLRKRNWYYFADYGVEASALAADIYREDPDAVVIFGEKRDDHSEAPDYPCFFLNTSLAHIVAQKKNAGAKCKVFLMRENDIGVNSRANRLHELPVEVYARTTNGHDQLSGNIHFFHSYDCCARQYWLSRPLRREEKTIVLIGFDHYGRSILERAILTNVLSTDQCIRYHIFGNAEKFLALHYRLRDVFSINQEDSSRDSLIFHKEFWGEQHEILEQADRIIICEDDVQEGWKIFWNLDQYCKIRGRIDLRNNRISPGVSYFGTNEEIYTLRNIIRTELNRAAIIINDIFRRSVSYPTLDWDDLDDFHRQSKIVAADHLHMKVRVLLEDESITGLSSSTAELAYQKYCRTKTVEAVNESYRKLDYMRWLRFYVFYNWSYGPVHDDKLRQHPMLCGYEKLTPEQKRERDAAWELLGEVSKELKTHEYKLSTPFDQCS
jgi:hypothetical protein